MVPVLLTIEKGIRTITGDYLQEKEVYTFKGCFFLEERNIRSKINFICSEYCLQTITNTFHSYFFPHPHAQSFCAVSLSHVYNMKHIQGKKKQLSLFQAEVKVSCTLLLHIGTNDRMVFAVQQLQVS